MLTLTHTQTYMYTHAHLPTTPTHHTHLAGKEGDGTFLRFEDGDDLIDEGGVGLLLQVGLKTDVGALHLGGHVYCEVGVSLEGRREGEGGREG